MQRFFIIVLRRMNYILHNQRTNLRGENMPNWRNIPLCYEHARDQGTLGSVAGCRHSRTPGRTYGFLIGKKWPYGRPGGSRDEVT
jgi:hypothetical protein